MKYPFFDRRTPTALRSWLMVPFALFLAVSSVAKSDENAATKSRTSESDIQTIINNIDAYLMRVSEKQFSGAILVDYQGKKRLSKGYGQADRVKGIDYTPHTISDIGSVTKQFTAAAILKLEMQGKLSTSDTLSKYFPMAPQDKANITLHQMLNMSAGFHTYSDTEGDFEAVTKEDFIDGAMAQKLYFPPGSGWKYSNTSYSLLAYLVEEISGLSYETYLYQNLFKPSGMENTGYSRPDFSPSKVAVQHRNAIVTGKPTEKPWDGGEPYFHLKGNGGILSTTEDLFKWHQALLTNKVLSQQAKAKYFQSYVKAWGKESKDHYAYGWFVRDTPRNTRLIHHSGGNGSAFTYFYRFIDEDITFILVCNDNDGFNSKISEQIKGLLFDIDFEPMAKTAYLSLDTLLDKGMTVDELLAFIKNEYRNSKESHSDYNLSQDWINHYGYTLIQDTRLDEALKVFRLNTELHPTSANTYDSLGEILITLGRIEEGIKAYQNALKLNAHYENAVFARKAIQQKRNDQEK